MPRKKGFTIKISGGPEVFAKKLEVKLRALIEKMEPGESIQARIIPPRKK